jgi:hypothetical protein
MLSLLQVGVPGWIYSAALVADKNSTKFFSLLGPGLCCFVGPHHT